MPQSDESRKTLYRGTIVNPIGRNRCKVYRDGGLVVNGRGKIAACGDYKHIVKAHEDGVAVDYSGHVITPGFIDLHTHIPQLEAVGVGSGELLPWLKDTIFPLEAKFKDKVYAAKTARKFFREALGFGTTTVVAYSSVHSEATNALFEEAKNSGIRAFIGKCLMDANYPDYLTETTDSNIYGMLKLIGKWHGKDAHRLQYIVSPRYAGSCSHELLKAASKVAADKGLLIQTHLAENRKELAYIHSLFPRAGSYTDVYDSAGLLGDRTLLAHCIHLNNRELGLLKEKNCSVVHCPTSNRYLQSGIMPLARYLEMGLKTGLGTDIAAGYSLSVLNECKEARESAKSYNIMAGETQLPVPQAQQLLYMATLGAAKILGIDKYTGSIEVGKEADFAVLRMDRTESGNENDAEYIIGKLMYSCFYRQVFRTYVRGACVFGFGS